MCSADAPHPAPFLRCHSRTSSVRKLCCHLSRRANTDAGTVLQASVTEPGAGDAAFTPSAWSRRSAQPSLPPWRPHSRWQTAPLQRPCPRGSHAPALSASLGTHKGRVCTTVTPQTQSFHSHVHVMTILTTPQVSKRSLWVRCYLRVRDLIFTVLRSRWGIKNSGILIRFPRRQSLRSCVDLGGPTIPGRTEGGREEGVKSDDRSPANCDQLIVQPRQTGPMRPRCLQAPQEVERRRLHPHDNRVQNHVCHQ